MPLYHFHVHSTVKARDHDGLIMADLAEARAHAIVNARALVIEEMLADHRFSPNHAIEITDESGTSLHMTRYGDCIEVRL